MRESDPWSDIRPHTPGGKYLRQFWQPICRSIDLQNGQIFGIQILGEEWTLYRGEDGVANVLAGLCPHRGTPLSIGVVCGANVQCLHHGLTFQPNGKSLQAGYEIRSVQTQEKYGLIFAYFGTGLAPDLYFELLERPGKYWLSPPEVWPCSFFLRLENTLDVEHVRSAHRYSAISETLSSTAYEFNSTPEKLRLTLEAGPVIDYLPPNRLIFPVPISTQIGWQNILCFRVPINEDKCISFSVAVLDVPFPPVTAAKSPFSPSEIGTIGEQILRGETSLAALVGKDNLTEIEDYVILVATHRARNKTEKLAPFDKAIQQLRLHWQEACRNL